MSTAPASIALNRAAVHSFVDDVVRPRATEFDRTGRIAEDVIAALSEAGLWAPFLPENVGGAGLSMVALGAAHEEIGRGCSSVRSLLTVHAMVTWAVQRWGSTGQRERWLPALATGSAIGAFCLTEPGGGSSATAPLTTTATRHGKRWSLNGIKMWITGAQRADLFLVFARTERGSAAFLVPRDAKGVQIRPVTDVLGTRGSMLGELTLREVLVAPDAVVGPDGFASKMVMTGVLDLGRYSVAAGCVGIVQACLDACSSYSTNHSVGGVALRDLQLIQAKITDMVTDVQAGRLLYERAGRLKDAGDPETVMATWIAKYFASTAAARHAAEAVQIHGANGCGGDYPVERFYRDAKIMEIIEGSTELQRVTIAAHTYQGAGHDT